MFAFLRTFVFLVSFLSYLLLWFRWLLGRVTAVLFYRTRSGKARHPAASAGRSPEILVLPEAGSLVAVDACPLHASPAASTELAKDILIPEGQGRHRRILDKNKLGSGYFGVVYKGTLGDGDVIAVKALKNNEQWQFENEGHLLQLRHGNIVKLVGRFISNNQLLTKVVGDPPTGNNCPTLGWAARHKIIKGICCGLRYLHDEWEVEKQMLHLDIKPCHILLDKAMNPKISDFGLSRIVNRALKRSG
ncbi:hypothetical protein BAE44_0005774 [Dichanthelium oligosanthes]|uniref:non-specific serine/threonine protein kinase n=1 Tax=Dichanthelium oligosanthes TaxID=888268 RepID=A0A1E5W770_9POAL|nr:hypothetical protein BAE44_0005774 [Dichanthelium oligosanthes]